MLQRALLLSLVVSFPLAAAPKVIAPATIAHPMALFLKDLSANGKQRVTFKATAVGTRFFFEEPAGVTVYTFDAGGYRREAFMKDATLAKAIKKYGSR